MSDKKLDELHPALQAFVAELTRLVSAKRPTRFVVRHGRMLPGEFSVIAKQGGDLEEVNALRKSRKWSPIGAESNTAEIPSQASDLPHTSSPAMAAKLVAFDGSNRLVQISQWKEFAAIEADAMKLHPGISSSAEIAGYYTYVKPKKSATDEK